MLRYLFLLKIPFIVTKRLNITQIRYDRLSIIDGILQYHYCTLQRGENITKSLIKQRLQAKYLQPAVLLFRYII